MITIYESNETEFLHRGLGTLPDATEAEVQEEINGVFDLRMLYPRVGLRADLIEEERILKASTPKGVQLFRIEDIRKDMDFIEIHANHVFYDLRQNFIEDTYIQNKGGAGAIAQVLDMSVIPHRFTSTSNVQGAKNCRIVRTNTVESMLGDDDNSLLTRWGGEFERDNFQINWLQRLGQNRGVKIKYRKNLTGLDFGLSLKAVVTRIMPQGFDGLLLPEKYIDSNLIGNYHTVKIEKRKYEDIISEDLSPGIEGAVPHADALQALRDRAAGEYQAGIDKPEIYCEVDFVDLSQTEEYKHYKDMERLFIGDDVKIYHPGIGIDLLERMVSYRWDALKERYINMLIGSVDHLFFGAIAKAESAGNAALEQVSEIRPGMREMAEQVATSLINAGFGGHVRVYPDRILIMDTEDEATALKVWQWNINGLGFSSTGVNGIYETAMIDGMFLGDRIVAGTITANQLAADIGQSLDLSSNVQITQMVSTQENVNADLDERITSTSSQISQLSASVDMSFTNLEERVIENETHRQEVQSNITFDTDDQMNPQMRMTRSDKPKELVLNFETGLKMLDDGVVTLEASDQQVFTTRLVVKESINFGNHIAQKYGTKYTIFNPLGGL